MNYKKAILFITVILLFSFFKKLECPKVGSNSSASRQLKTFFPASDTNNRMEGFAAFENGLTLENSSTTCIFDAFFPVSGDITLNGGMLYLYRDALFKSPFSIGVGRIDGRSFSIEFPSNISSLKIPSDGHNEIFSYCDEKSIGDNINDVDWSFDDSYIAVVCDSFGGNELQIFSFENDQLTLVASHNFGLSSAYVVKWHPSLYYLAVGKRNGDELYTFFFNKSNNTLEQKAIADIGIVYGIAWSPSGNELAVGRYNQNNLLVYDFQDGLLSNEQAYTLYEDVGNLKSASCQKQGLSWSYDGDYLAAAFRIKKNDNSVCYAVKLFHFDGGNFIDDAYMEMSSSIGPISWRPNSSLISIGLYNGSERFRLYKHDPSEKTLEEITNARLGESRSVYDISWCEGAFVAYVKRKGSINYELQVYTFNSEENTFCLVSGHNYTTDLKTLAWSHNGNYIATGGSGDKLVVLSFASSPLIFKDVSLFFKSDVIFNGDIIFDGSCVLNMGRNILEFANGSSMTVSAGGQLIIEDARIKGISDNNIVCQDDDCVITLRDVVWIQDGNFSFSNGALRWKNDVLMSGDYMFGYETIKTSTLLSKSTLELDVGFTFCYDPVIGNKNLLEMEDETSVLLLNGATLHATGTGLQLMNGKMRVLRDSFLSSEITTTVDEFENEITIDEGITLGNNNDSNDLVCDIFSGVTLHVLQGSLNYKNVLHSSWSMNNLTSVLHMYPNTTLNVYQNLDLGRGSLLLEDNAFIGRALGENLTGSIRPQGALTYVNI